MPGANCCIVDCPTYASKTRYPALSFFKIPKGKVHEEWQSQLIRIVNRVDNGFNPDNAFICSRHFKESCYKTGTFVVKCCDIFMNKVKPHILRKKVSTQRN